ncbi:ComF family protein [Pseudogulbenkiania sp. NH8B]|uniref:ComF family protein n=1 Tax=Pseudogulbenkiania sp. (strain NH8B) TaxID=748280 RepID=UPI00059F5DC9|nr:ComF family protein [Pseudogulbenkiania sp. NH8B]
MLSNLFGRLIDNRLFFNQPCLLCGTPGTRHGLCPPCHACLPRLPAERCPHCAEPVVAGSLCGACQRHPPAFDALHVSYRFDYPLDGLIHAFKYGKRLEMAGALGRLLAEQAPLSAPAIDLIVPVPLAKERLAARGFNQSHELAHALAATMQVRFDANLCWRKYNTRSQTTLDRAERHRNMKHAFGVKRCLDGLCIAIVDDVATSGATLSALAATLKKQGAKRVEAWVLARAISLKT